MIVLGYFALKSVINLPVFNVDVHELLGFGEYLLDYTGNLRAEFGCAVECFLLYVLPVLWSAVKNNKGREVRPE